MANRKNSKWQFTENYHVKKARGKSKVTLLDDDADKVFENIAAEFQMEQIKICSFMILQELIKIKGMDPENYYSDIINLVDSATSENDIEIGIIKIAKKASNEMNLRMQYMKTT